MLNTVRAFAGESQEALVWAADVYEQAQRTRVQVGERIRALLQGRQIGAEPSRQEDAAVVLKRILAGEDDGPSDFLTRAYRLHAAAEEEARGAMQAALECHPAWPWLGGVKGVGSTLACRLLARLDPVRASTPSGFWAYCGLGTVPAVEYACRTCGRVLAQPVEFQVSGIHQRLGAPGRCPDRLRPRRGPESGARAAQPRPLRGQRRPYNPEAKKVCYLTFVSFMRCRGAYSEYYREVRSGLEGSRPGWAKGKIHLAAGRKTQKLFLVHLWVSWRQAVGLRVTIPHPDNEDDRWLDPWRMHQNGTSGQ
jgi:hypothetical protein